MRWRKERVAKAAVPIKTRIESVSSALLWPHPWKLDSSVLSHNKKMHWHYIVSFTGALFDF